MMFEAIQGCPRSQVGDNSSLIPLLSPNFGLPFFRTESGLGPEPWHENVFKCSHCSHPWLKDVWDQGQRTGGPLDNEPPGARTSHLYLLCANLLAQKLNYICDFEL